ncbi:MAG: hypothetical protein B7Z08_09970 [Sphingomonadales bacterium 32-68-7]|nr:MAG: hypothetical protein B7Z33_06200 [Sphingomonadales bacterium 12-68-11]OYX08317.1 MAG: hypothetical protein B7Z08_09970 [Sphingomonadales bacterium 32-68-7]
MDFAKWLNSLDEVLFEVMSWLVFFPLTLARAIVWPLGTMEYANRELHDREALQFDDTLSPPLFLLVALLLSHAFELAVGQGDNPIVDDTHGLAGLVNDDGSLLVLRLLFFSLFPLMLATRLVWARGQRLTRPRLKAPFYAQCYATAPFALVLGAGTTLATTQGPVAAPVGAALILAAVIWFVVVEVRWFQRHLPAGLLSACWSATLGIVSASVGAFSLGHLFT